MDRAILPRTGCYARRDGRGKDSPPSPRRGDRPHRSRTVRGHLARRSARKILSRNKDLGAEVRWHGACLSPVMTPVTASARRLTTLLLALLAGSLAVSGVARGNDLLKLYELARTHDATLTASTYSRDAASEQRPLAIAQLLPQLHVSASADRERLGSQISSAPVKSRATSAAAPSSCPTRRRIRS